MVNEPKRRSRRVARLQPGQDAVMKVALLFSDGVPQKKIASMLSLSPSMVSKLVGQAQQNKYLEETPRCQLRPSLKKSLREELRRGEKLHDLLKRFADECQVPSVQHLRVIPTTVPKIKNYHDWDLAALSFGKEAAPYCLDLILRCRVLGVTFGRALAALIAGLRQLRGRAAPVEQQVLCVPLWGEPVGPRAVSTSKIFTETAKLGSTGLAHQLHEVLYGPNARYQPLSLDFVPCFRPPNKDSFLKRHFEGVLEFARFVGGYDDIFSGRPEDVPHKAPPRKTGVIGQSVRQSVPVRPKERPLADHLDAILTSVGSPEQPGRFLSGEFFYQGDIDPKVFFPAVIGDLGGVFFPKPNATDRQRRDVQDANDRWTGVRLEHFRRCSLMAREHDLPGVTVCAIGRVRGPLLRVLVSQGLINTLLIDTECAQELEHLIH